MQVSLNQVRSTIPAGYRIVSTLSGGDGIDDELFLFRYSDDEYQSVVSVDDIYRYPTSKTAGYDYYRLAVSSHDLTTLGAAISHAAAQKSALAELVPAYSTAVDDFVGSEDTVYTDT